MAEETQAIKLGFGGAQTLVIETPYCGVAVTVLNGLVDVSAIHLTKDVTVEMTHAEGDSIASIRVRKIEKDDPPAAPPWR